MIWLYYYYVIMDCLKILGIKKFDGPSNFEVYWSVPPSVKSVAE